jgi:hypothetical protein
MLPCAVAALAGEPGFTPVFAGTDLTGWRYGKDVLHRQSETSDKRFYAADNVIVMAAKDREGKKTQKELISVREFSKDFILKLEFKAAQEAIGHVTIRNTAFPVADYTRRGEQTQLKNFKKDDWNEMEIVVKMAAYAEGRRLSDSDNLEAGFSGGKAWAKLNGTSIDPNRTVIQIEAVARVNGETLQYYPVAIATKGQVSLRTGSGKIEFRNIRFKELP